jgi:replicative DNA helicase
MKKSRPELEIAAIKAALDVEDEQIKAILLGSFRRRLFGYEIALEIYDRMEVLTKSGKSLPNSSVFSHDASLSEAAQSLLKAPAANTPETVVETEDDARALLDNLRRHDHARILFNTVQSVTQEMATDNPAIDLCAREMETALTSINAEEQSEQLFHLGKGHNSKEVFDRILNPNIRDIFLPTGFDGFDARAGGLSKSNLLILACHRKGGKSILKLNMGIGMYFAGYSGCIVTLEMGEDEYMGRLYSAISGVPYEKIRLKTTTKADRARISHAYEQFNDFGETQGKRLTIWPTMTMSVANLGMLLKPYHYDFVIIDYLNLLQHDEPQEWKRLSEIARECKQLTGILGCPIIASTQMNTDGGNIRYSRAIEEHADYILKWVYGEAEETSGIIEVEQMVSRHTERFSFKLRADYEHMRVADHVEAPGSSGVNEEMATGLDFMEEL